MNCPHCCSSNTVPRQPITNQGYSLHCCRDCGKTFNDGLTSYPKAIREELGAEVNHKRVSYQKNPLLTEHQGDKTEILSDDGPWRFCIGAKVLPAA